MQPLTKNVAVDVDVEIFIVVAVAEVVVVIVVVDGKRDEKNEAIWLK